MIINPFGFAFDLLFTSLLVFTALWQSFISPSESRTKRVIWKAVGVILGLWLAILLVVASDYHA